RGEVLRRPGRRDVARLPDQPLPGQEAGRQLLVLAGRAHGHGQWLAVDPYLERLLHGELVAHSLARAAVEDALDPSRCDVAVEGGAHALMFPERAESAQ